MIKADGVVPSASLPGTPGVWSLRRLIGLSQPQALVHARDPVGALIGRREAAFDRAHRHQFRLFDRVRPPAVDELGRFGGEHVSDPIGLSAVWERHDLAAPDLPAGAAGGRALLNRTP